MDASTVLTSICLALGAIYVAFGSLTVLGLCRAAATDRPGLRPAAEMLEEGGPITVAS